MSAPVTGPVWVENGLVPAAQARISVADRGLLTGEGVFGSIKLGDEEYKNNGVFRRSSVSNFLSYNSLEIVFARFQKGYASIMLSNYMNDGDVSQGKILPETIGEMEDVTFGYHRNFFGLKLLLK